MASTEITTIVAELEARLKAISFSGDRESAGSPGSPQDALEATACCLRELREFIKSYTFSDEKEEIDFFKNIKPRFLSQYYYQKQASYFSLHEPLDRQRDIDAYCRAGLAQLELEMKADLAFADYMASGRAHLDGVYFRRGFVPATDFETDAEFSTGYDDKAGRMLAAGMMRNHIVSLLEKHEENGSESALNWTGSKADLIELIYGLETLGVINKGNVEIKEIAAKFEALFNISLGNYYRQFLDIRLRKKEKTTFLNQMQQRLEQRMNDFG